MRWRILLTVIVALVAGMAGTAAAGERGRHHHHLAPHAGIKLHAGHHRAAIAPGFRHHHHKRLHQIRPAGPRFAHRKPWRGDGHHRSWHKQRWHPHALEHRGHHGHRPLIRGFRHDGARFVIAPGLLGGAVKVIIGSHGRDLSKRHHRFSKRHHHIWKRHRRFRD